MSKQNIKTCIVGLGWWGDELVNASKNVDGLEINTCFARTESTRSEFAKKHSCRPIESWEGVLNDTEIDAIFLATPHSTHASMIVDAANAKKHILVEKPFVLNVAEGITALDACSKANVKLAVGHQRRFQPAHRKLKDWIQSGKLGTIVQAEANFSYGFASTLSPDSWRSNPDESPAGAMTGLGIHQVDNLQYFLGPVKNVFSYSKSVKPDTDLEDVTVTLLEFESGSFGYLGSNMLTPKVFYARVYGTEGNAIAENEGTRITLWGKDNSELVEEFEVSGDPVTAPLVAEISDFAQSIIQDYTPEVDGVVGLRNSAVLEAIILSSREKRIVTIEELY
tara:strand:+ start:14849 stop:15859 length:1011 start_codon:yes stop_codon:yes gene_type:complete